MTMKKIRISTLLLLIFLVFLNMCFSRASAAENSISAVNTKEDVAITGTVFDMTKRVSLIIIRPGFSARDITKENQFAAIEHISTVSTDASGVFTYHYTLSGSGGDGVYTIIVGSLNSVQSVSTTFEYQGPLARLNASAWQDIKKMLLYENTLLNLDVLAFARLHADDQAVVCKALQNKGFGSTTALQDALNRAVSSVLKSQPADTGGGGRSGSNTNNITVDEAFVPSIPTPKYNEYVFNDLADVPWAADAVIALAERGVVNGDGDGNFYPAREVTREEFVKMLVVGCGLLDENARTDFVDVSEDAWYYPYIASAVQAGMVRGVSAHRFSVGTAITREEMAVIAYRAIARKSDTVGEPLFADADEIQDYAKEAVSAMQSFGIINGVDGGKFAPAQTCTRAMVAKVVYGVLEVRNA